MVNVASTTEISEKGVSNFVLFLFVFECVLLPIPYTSHLPISSPYTSHLPIPYTSHHIFDREMKRERKRKERKRKERKRYRKERKREGEGGVGRG